MVTQFIPVIEWELDDTTHCFALDGTATPSTFYQKGVVSISTISREIPRLCGLFSIGSVIITFDNSKQVFSKLKAEQPWRGRTLRILYGDAMGSFSNFAPAYTGVVVDWSFQGDKTTVTVVDNSLDLFNEPVTKTLRRVTAGGYPDAAPSYSKGELIAYVDGLCQAPVGSVDNGGQLPAYMINESTFVYVAAVGDLSATVENVYVYGIKQTITTDYTISTMTATGGEVYTLFTFTADPRDLVNHTTDETEVTWSGGSSEQRPIYQLETYLTERVGVDAAELDVTTWNTVKAEFDARGYVGTLVVTKRDLTHGEVVARHLKSNGLQLFRKGDGTWALNFIGLSKTAALALTEKNITAGTFLQKSYTSDSLASRLHVNYDYNYASPGMEYFQHTPDLISNSEITNLGSDIADNLSLWFARSFDGDASTPLSIAALYLALRRESGIVVECEIPIENFNAVDLGDVYTLTHWEGIGVAGFVDTRIVILAIRFIPSAAKSKLVLVGYVEPDLPSDSPILSATFEIGGGLTVEEVTSA
jgi:hypothetical protein